MKIGNLIRQVMTEKGIKPGKFAQKVGIHISSVSRMLQYDELGTAILKRICQALDYDFFAHYSAELKLSGKGSASGVISKSEAEQNAKALELARRDNEECTKEKESLKGEIGYLKQINELLSGKK